MLGILSPLAALRMPWNLVALISGNQIARLATYISGIGQVPILATLIPGSNQIARLTTYISGTGQVSRLATAGQEEVEGGLCGEGKKRSTQHQTGAT